MTGINGADILRWEQDARQSGSLIQASQLLARWNLDQVFDRSGQSGGLGTSSLLRAFQACLILAPHGEEPSDRALAVANQISVGPLVLRFEGEGQLIGRRPLLQFSFTSVMLKLGAVTLLQRTLARPTAKSMPFFALIRINHNDGTLAARGRGGGLAVWKRDASSNRHVG